MKNIIIIIAAFISGSLYSQVAIGKTALSSNSVSLEFGNANRGMILPWVTSTAGVTGVVNGTMVYDITDKKVKAKYAAGWKDFSINTTGTTVDPISGVDGLSIQNAANEITTAKAAIGTLTATPGILVLEDNNKAMILPKTNLPHLNIINPAPGMMVYDTTNKHFAVYNGTYWSFWTYASPSTAIATLDCAGATNNGTLTHGTAASGVNSVINYTGGNGSAHTGQVVASTGVTGLTATLAAGSFANGNGALTYNITGTPATGGTASFAISIGGLSCTLTRTVGLLVSTFAGSGATGNTNGVGTAASFNFPLFIVADPSDNLYVTQGIDNRIRKITSGAVVSIFAGSGPTGASIDGTGTGARFGQINDLASDLSGNLYVCEGNNNTTTNKIRMVTPGGVVTTLAGANAAGYADGTGSAARFDGPFGIVYDKVNNWLYVSEANGINAYIRKVTLAGVVTTVAGGTVGNTNGTGTAAKFSAPSGMAIDASGNVFICDINNNNIRKMTPAGVVTTFAGSGAASSVDGTGLGASFDSPIDCVFDTDGNLIVVDDFGAKIRKITPAGVVTTLAGTGNNGSTDGNPSTATFTGPRGITINSLGALFIVDVFNNKIRKID